jgi:hypothetical protein
MWTSYLAAFPIRGYLPRNAISLARVENGVIRSGPPLFGITLDTFRWIHVSTTKLEDVSVAFAMLVSPEIPRAGRRKKRRLASDERRSW